MKESSKSLFLLAGAITAMLINSGCAKSNGDAPAPATTPTPTDTNNVNPTTPTPTDVDVFQGLSGGNVKFTPAGLDVMTRYVMIRPINTYSDVEKTMRLLVNLRDIGNNRWAGDIRIGYQDTNRTFIGTFSTGTGKNKVSYKNWYVGLPEAEFNQWFTFNKKRVFHAFFQDRYGAVILVIDGGIDQGDGGGITELSGKVYFKNFPTGQAAQSPEKCWFHLPPSPYDCGTFRVGERVVTTSALYPSNGYELLGTFSGLNTTQAFQGVVP